MTEREISILIGGRAGDGISSAGQVVAHLLGHLGYSVYMYLDYPSRIKGGHNYAVVRAAGGPVGAVRNQVDFILALNQETVDRHKTRLSGQGVILYNTDSVTSPGGIGISVKTILAGEQAPAVMGNSVFIGAFSKAAGISWEVTEHVLEKSIPKETGKNLRVARRAYDVSEMRMNVMQLDRPILPVFTGNEAIGLGLIEGGLQFYFGYPMSPTSNLLHFLAGYSEEARIRVIQPESEIAVLLMALGCAYAGKKAAVGTSGGGFCLMTEGLGLAGIAELPALIILGQRAGPSTGLATYTAQADLHFALNAGQGEFPRLIVAPGDAEEAMSWAATGMDLAWKYQIPAIILSDKTICEGVYSLDPEKVFRNRVAQQPAADPAHPYYRYMITDSGISPMRSPPMKGGIIRANSHVHEPDGITTEEPGITRAMADKRNRKMGFLREEIEGMQPVNTGGKPDGTTALVCWGSNKGICNELGSRIGLRVIQPVVLWPFPVTSLSRAMNGVEQFFTIELNETGQIGRLLREFGYHEQGTILKYDGRPFTVEELEAEIRKVIA
jgi:2-oxoglutarate/2-oxoacid ferredoxin oxidoreductase subunit alpha